MKLGCLYTLSWTLNHMIHLDFNPWFPKHFSKSLRLQTPKFSFPETLSSQPLYSLKISRQDCQHSQLLTTQAAGQVQDSLTQRQSCPVPLFHSGIPFVCWVSTSPIHIFSGSCPWAGLLALIPVPALCYVSTGVSLTYLCSLQCTELLPVGDLVTAT